MFTGKRELLNRIEPSLVQHFVELLKKDKAPQYIDFLMSICMLGTDTKPEPLSKVQNMVTFELLEEHMSLLPQLRLEPNQKGVMRVLFRVEGQTTEFLNLANFKRPDFVNSKGRKEDYAGWIMNSALSELDLTQRSFRYLIRCTNLYGRLALGRNQKALKLLICNPSLCLDYSTILSVMKEESLPYLFRARYTTLMARLFVDRDPQTQIPTIVNTRVWSKVVPEDSDLNVDGVDAHLQGANPIPTCTNGFVDLQSYLLSSIPKVADCKNADKSPGLNGKPGFGQLQFINAELELTDMMMDFGFFRGLAAVQQQANSQQAAMHSAQATATATIGFHPAGSSESIGAVGKKPGHMVESRSVSFDNIKILFEALFAILDSRDGSSNVAARKNKKGADQQEVDMRNKVRVDALWLLLRILDIRMNYRVTETIACYEKIFERLCKDPLAYSRMSKTGSDPGPMSMGSFKSGISDVPSNYIASVGKLEECTEEDLKAIFLKFESEVTQLGSKMFEHNIISSVQVGSDIYKEGSFDDVTLHVMLDLCTFQDPGISRLALQLLFRNMSQKNALLQQLQDVQILVFPLAAKVYKEVKYVIKRFSSCQKYIFRSAQAEQQTQAKQVQRPEEATQDAEAFQEVSTLLHRLTTYLTESKESKAEIITKNQSIMLNLGIDIPVRRLLGLDLHRDTSLRDKGEITADLPGSEKLRDLFQLCYTFLTALARKNVKAQKLLFPHLKQFADHIGIEKLNVAQVIMEVIRDNKRLTGRIGEDLFSKFVASIKKCGRRARWLSFFQPFMIMREKIPVKRNQDVILRVLLDDKEAVLDLTCDYRSSPYLSKSDERYGKTRIDLLLENDHKRAIFSLLQYHVATLKTLCASAFGKNTENINKIGDFIPFSMAVNSILDVDVRENGVREQNINPDAIRFVQVGWVQLLADVHFSCSGNDTSIVQDILASSRIWGVGKKKSLIAEFASNIWALKERLDKQNGDDFWESPHLLNGVGDEYGHNLGTHLELALQITRASRLYLQKRDLLAEDRSDELVSSEDCAQLRDNMVHLYTALSPYGFTQMRKSMAELMSVMNEAGVKGMTLANQADKVPRVKPPPTTEKNFQVGFQRFRSYLNVVNGIDSREERCMDKAIRDIARCFGNSATYMNDKFQSLRELMKFMQTDDCTESLRRNGLKVLRAILYMRPGELTPIEEEREYTLYLDNQFCTFVGQADHVAFQQKMANLGMVDVVTKCFQDDHPDIVMATLQLAVTLLDGSDALVQEHFAQALLPASSTPFFVKLNLLFVESQEALKDQKKNIKQAELEKAALQKAGIHSSAGTNVAQQDLSGGQEQMTEVLKFMRRCCLGEGELDNVFRVQRLNHISINFFIEAVQYLEAIEPELRDAIEKGEMRQAHDSRGKNTITWFSPLVDSVMRGFLMLADSMTGPNIENQKVIAETGIFDLCDRVLARIKFEHIDNYHHHHPSQEKMPSADKDLLRARNELRCALKCAVVKCLESFLEGIEDPSIANQMLMQLNWDGVVEQMKACYHVYQKNQDLPKARCLEEGQSYYRILVHSKHYDRQNEFIAPALEHVPPKIILFYEQHTGHIEIVRDQRLERVYFRLPEVCLRGGPLDKKIVQDEMYNTDREDLDKKNREFIENMCERVEIEQFENAIRQTPLSFTVNKLGLIRQINFAWTLSMHILMVHTSYMPRVGFWASSFQEDYQERIWIEQGNPVALGYSKDAKFKDYCGDWCDNEFLLTERDIYFFYEVQPVAEKILRYMSWINLITCGLRFFSFCYGELPNIVRFTIDKQKKEALEEIDEVEEDAEPADEYDEDEYLLDLVWTEDYQPLRHQFHHTHDDDAVDDKSSEGWERVTAALSCSTLHYEMGFVLFPLIAICTDEPLLAFYCLFEILFWEGSKPVVQAITINAGKMFQLVILGILCIYVWLVVGMLLLHDAHYQDFCSNMFQCFMSYIDISIRAYGVHEVLKFVEESFKYPHNIVDALGVHEDSRTTGVFLIRLLWDASFQILFGYIIIIGIIPGIIIDAFGELKARREEVCLIIHVHTYIYTYACAHICIYAYMHVVYPHIDTYIHIYVYTYIHAINIYIHIHVCTQMSVLSLYGCVIERVSVFAFLYACFGGSSYKKDYERQERESPSS